MGNKRTLLISLFEPDEKEREKMSRLWWRQRETIHWIEARAAATAAAAVERQGEHDDEFSVLPPN